MDPKAGTGTLLVVGIGASAGGISALQEFAAHVSPTSGIAWVVILHLSPDHESRLAEVLQGSTELPVSQIADRTPLQPDHIYVAPPNRSLEIVDDALIPKELSRLEQRRAPIDVFFRTLASTHDSRACCVVLSGTGSDGTSGLKVIKEHGGLTVAQDLAEAQYPPMPESAIATGLVDLVLPAAAMPDRIVDYFEGLVRVWHKAPASESAVDPADIREVLALLRAKTGHDFSSYKHGTVQRRIERRVQVRGFVTVTEYTAFLGSHPEEATALMKELLISVTNFFRDPEAWRALQQRVIPRLFAAPLLHDKLRVWVPGCATGEEAYSLAMLLSEHALAMSDSPPIQVFGSDLDATAIAVAREGVYTGPEVADVSEDRLRRFFQVEPGGYRVKRELREMVLFAHHNVIKDPPFSHLDMVSCRNLLIYLNKTVQERVLETFSFALRAGGYLFLGTSESADAAASLFVTLDRNAHIYECVSAARPPRLVDERNTGSVGTDPAMAPRVPTVVSPPELHQRLLEQFGAPSLIVSDDHIVVHVSERAGRYLQVPGGEPSRDVLHLIRADLQADLRTALHEAGRERRAVDVRGVKLSLDDGPHVVDLSVRPALKESDPPRGFFLVMFYEAAADAGDPLHLAPSGPTTDAERATAGELTRVKAHLRATVEQYETQAEAAQAANEELQALNEELRSSAEELETSKEELQSVNEELTTVNQELKIKIEELGLINNDFQNFINSTDMATIFLDRMLRVKLFTTHAKDVFNLRETDVGRYLSDITSHVANDKSPDDVRRVLETLQTVEREVPTRDGRCYAMRIRPYRTVDNHIDGVVLTFQDITARREAELRGHETAERLRLLTESAADYAMFTTAEDGRVESWNPGAERMFGYTSEEIVGRPIDVLFTREDRAAQIPQRELETARRTGRAADERYHVRKDGTRFYVSGTTTRLGEGGIGFAKIARDLTAQQQAEDALRHAYDDLDARVKARTRELETEKTIVTDLVRRIVTAQEDERARIARDLHDSMGQQMTALRLTLERHGEQCQVRPGQVGVEDALALTAAVSDQMDFLARQLRPAALEDLGLASALPRFVEAWSTHTGIAAEFRMDNFQARSLPQDVETTFYRIAQEALNNVAKHAHASRVDVMLAGRDGTATMIIEDDGIGFEPSEGDIKSRGMGLLTMRERVALVGATLDVEAGPGRGTSIYVRAPLQAS